jgi:hypothetical protein
VSFAFFVEISRFLLYNIHIGRGALDAPAKPERSAMEELATAQLLIEKTIEAERRRILEIVEKSNSTEEAAAKIRDLLNSK